MSKSTTPKRVISPAVARHVLYVALGDTNHGTDPGSFMTRLIRTIQIADQSNQALLKKVYPEVVVATQAALRESWGPQWLLDVSREVA